MLAGPALADPPTARPPIGRWLTQDGDGVVEIRPCGNAMCGRIVGMDAPTTADGKLVLDANGRPQCGLDILQAVRDERDRWTGTITDPGTGDRWRCLFWVDHDEHLNLRGYVLLPALGRTQIWTRFTAQPAPDCRF